MFARKDGHVSVWFGTGLTKKSLDAYVRDENSKGEPSSPIDEFARDGGTQSYDQDKLVCFHRRGKDKPFAKVIGEWQGSRQLEESVLSAQGEKMPVGNCVLLLFDAELKPARWPKRSPFQFLGTFSYQHWGPGGDAPQHRKDDHKDTVCEASVAPGGRYAVTAAYDDCFKVWDLKKGTFIARRPMEEPELVGWLSDNEFVTAAGSNFLLWRIESDKLRKKTLKTEAGFHRPIVSRELRAIIWVHARPVVGYVDNWQPDAAPYKPNVCTQSIIELDGARCATINLKQQLTVWNLETGRAEKRIDTKNVMLGCMTKSGRIASSAGLLDASSGKKIAAIKKSYALRCCSVLPNLGEGCFAGCEGSTVESSLVVWNDDGKIQSEATINEVNITSDFATRANLAFTASYDANVHAFDLESTNELASWRVAPEEREVESDPEEDGDGFELTAIGASPDGSRVIAGEASGRVHILSFSKQRGFKVLR